MKHYHYYFELNAHGETEQGIVRAKNKRTAINQILNMSNYKDLLRKSDSICIKIKLVKDN